MDIFGELGSIKAQLIIRRVIIGKYWYATAHAFLVYSELGTEPIQKR